MRAVVVYESMFGNTHMIADRVAEGLRSGFDVTVVPAAELTPGVTASADLVVVGGPTHAHGMARPATRRAAAESARKDPALSLDPSAGGDGVRDRLDTMSPARGAGAAAAFDTRMRGPAVLTGQACRGIARRLRRRGFHLVARPESFFVDGHNHLLGGEEDRAVAWGAALARTAHRT